MDIVYTIQELIALNNGQQGDVECFNKYAPPKKTFEAYNNKYNQRLKTDKVTKKIFNRAGIYSSDKIIEDIRKVINSVSMDKVAEPATNINRMIIPNNQVKKIAKLFHDSMISCTFLIDKYIELLLLFDNNELEYQIFRDLCKLVVSEFRTPSVFTDKDSSVETGDAKTKRFRIRNSIILAKLTKILNQKSCKYYLFRKGFEIDTISKRVLNSLFNFKNKYDVDVVLNIFPILTPLLSDSEKERRYTQLINFSNKSSDKILSLKITDLLPKHEETDSDSDDDMASRFLN